MKRKVLLVLAASSLCAIFTASLSAQSAESSFHRFNIPFGFGVQGKSMPAGEYIVRSYNSNGLVQIESYRGHEALNTLTYNTGTSAVNDRGILIFHRYDNQYFLAQVSCGEGNLIRGVRMSRAEREAVETASSRPVQTVTLVALLAAR